MRIIYSKRGELGGWYANTRKDPIEVLSSIARSASIQECGYIGYQWDYEREDYDKTVLRFEGIQICLIDESNSRWRKKDLRFSFCLEITDREKIHPGFFDLWLFHVSSKDVTGGPTQKDKVRLTAKSAEAEPKKKDDLPSERIIRLTTPVGTQISLEAEDIIVKAKTWERRLSSRRLTLKTIEYVARHLSGDPVYVLQVFELQRKEGKFPRLRNDVPTNQLLVGDFVSASWIDRHTKKPQHTNEI